MEQLETKLTELSGAIKAHVDKYNEETKAQGAATKETRDLLDKLIADHADTQKQIDAIDEKMQAAKIGRTAGISLYEHIKTVGVLKDIVERKVDRAVNVPKVVFELEGAHALDVLGLKTTVYSESLADANLRQTTGIIPIERDAGITLEVRRPLRIMDLLPARATDARIIDFVKVDTPMANAAEQSPEGSAKSENAVDFTSASFEVRTIATWIPVSTQMLADWGELENFLRTSLAYYLRKEIDDNLLYATGAGSSIHGLIPQATAFDNGLLPSDGAGSYTMIDRVGWAAGQLDIANEVSPNWVVMHPSQWWTIRMTKDSQGRYILAEPWTNGVPQLFGLTPVPTTGINDGQFLVGNSNSAAAEVRTRMGVTIAIGEQHSDYFTKNLVAIRAEERLCLVTKRGASFITGSTTTSPA